MRGERPWCTNRSRVLRSRPISAEATLWAHLRNRQLGGHKFVRQMPIGPYFADFVCRERKVIVEVDGGTHSTDEEVGHDAKHTLDLRALGYRTFRIGNHDVYHNIDCTLDALLAFIEESGGWAGALGCPSP